MPHVEPLPAATLVAIAGLFATVLALWIRPWWVLLAALLVAEAAGFVSGILSGPAGIWIFGLAIAVWSFRRTNAGWQRLLAFVGAAVMAGLLAAHAMSGFQNPVVLRDVVLSPGAMPYTIRQLRQDARRRPRARARLVRAAPHGRDWTAHAATGGADRRSDDRRRHGRLARARLRAVRSALDAAVLGLGADQPAADLRERGGVVPRVPAARTRRGARRARLCGNGGGVSALAFGLAHAGGGWRYVLLATIAGTGYALAWQRTGRIEASILAHFAVNATHFLLFTYPALA